MALSFWHDCLLEFKSLYSASTFTIVNNPRATYSRIYNSEQLKRNWVKVCFIVECINVIVRGKIINNFIVLSWQ